MESSSSPPDHEPRPELFGFRRDPDGSYYLTGEDLDRMMAPHQHKSEAQLFAEMSEFDRLHNRRLDTSERLDALRRLRDTGHITEFQAQIIIGKIYEGR